MNKTENPNVDKKGDFIFRWKLNAPKKKRRSKDPFKDFIRDLLKELLNIVVLTHNGEDIKADGFHFINSTHIFKIFG